MKPENARVPASVSAATTVAPALSSLDWPRQAGLAAEFRARVEQRLRRRRRARATTVAAVAVALFAVLWVVPLVRDTASMETRPTQLQTLALADGSRVELNARTALRTDFRYGRRTVRLDRGEAFFSVAKDAAHPFLVETPAGTVRVTGTQFNVRLTADHRAEVTLLEGAVTAESSAAYRTSANHYLSPHQQITLGDTAPALRTLTLNETENAVAWRSGRLVLDGLTLSAAVERLAAWHGRVITVVPTVADLHPGGSYPVGDLKAFLQALETALPVRVIPQGDGSLVIGAR